MAIDTNCIACDNLKKYAPDFVQNGVTESICTSLKNDTGFNPADDRNDCTDLNDANDCLIGNLVNEVYDYEVCDWQPFTEKALGNIYSVGKAAICAICGIWTNIHNILDRLGKLEQQMKDVLDRLDALEDKVDNFKVPESPALEKLVDKLSVSTSGKAFVRYYRDNSGTSKGYEWHAKENGTHTLTMYMNANGDNRGSQKADRDYLVIISYCCDMHKYRAIQTIQVWYSSGDTRSLATIRKKQGQHPADTPMTDTTQHSWTISTAVLVRKGEYLKFNAYDQYVRGSNPYYRIHQVTAIWIPVNFETVINRETIFGEE